MSLNTFFAYFGSKWEPAKRYPPPRHDTIIEPFAGGAGYSVRYHRRKVILVEKDPRVATLWRYLINVSAREILRLPLLAPNGRVSELRVGDEARLLIAYNVDRASAGPSDRFTRWSLRPADSHSVWGPTLRARIASQVERIRHWRVIEGDYSLAPDVEATWFVDPPYFGKLGDTYRCKGRALDFPALGAWCRSRRGQVMVCEQAPAAWLPFRHLGAVKATTRKAGHTGVSAEVIWTND